MAEQSTDPRRALPSVDRLARELERDPAGWPAWVCREAARRAIAHARERIAAGGPLPIPADAARQQARGLARAHPTRVVNATGVVLHTNLGRAPLAPDAARAVADVAAGYSDLELDLATGQRGHRIASLETLLTRLSGAPAAFAVNNCASAVLLALSTLARGREVIVSRGELVEIGGSFRVPEILEQAGVRLVEVGTTNRTHPRDYDRAIGPQTGAILKVHRSNFEQRGFVTEVALAELVEIGRSGGVPVIEDLGSATLLDLGAHGLPAEAYAPARLASGVDVLCFSGDKLLGGPQAGLVLGSPEAVSGMRRNPLARALRLDKLTLTALDVTLRALLEGRESEIPLVRMLVEDPAAVEARARALAARLAKLDRGRPGGWTLDVVASEAPVGGGSLPGHTLPSFAVSLRGPVGADAIVARLRDAPVPILARVEDDDVRLDARTLLPGDEALIESALEALVKAPAPTE